jgi:hypothetical protein
MGERRPVSGVRMNNEQYKGAFAKMLLHTTSLYDVYISQADRELYMERVEHLVGDWGLAIEAMDRAITANDQVPTPGELVRFAHPCHCEAPDKIRPTSHTYGENPREAIVERLAMSGFSAVYSNLAGVKKTRNNEMLAHCPFKKHRNAPSFNYNAATGLWICRSGCGAGSAFDYEMAVTGQSYSEVLHRLAWDLGIELNSKSDAKVKMKFMEER